jgi:hypothetical protein
MASSCCRDGWFLPWVTLPPCISGSGGHISPFTVDVEIVERPQTEPMGFGAPIEAADLEVRRVGF